jgi:hypothetical protein
MKSTEGARRGLPSRLLAGLVLVSCASFFLPHPVRAQERQKRPIADAMKRLGQTVMPAEKASGAAPSTEKARSIGALASGEAVQSTPRADAPVVKAEKAAPASKQERADALLRQIASEETSPVCREGATPPETGAPDETETAEKVEGTVNEVEPNDAPAAAQNVGAPEVTILGSARTSDAGNCGIYWGESFEDWEDWYSIQINTASVLQVHLGGFAQTDFDVAVVAVDPSRSCGGTIQAYGAQGTGVEEDLVVAVQPGRYLLAVTAFDLDPNEPFTSNYTVTVKAFSRSSFRTVTERESNNSPDTPQYVGNSNFVLTGSAGTSENAGCGRSWNAGFDDWEDWYAITLSTPSLVQIHLGKFGSADIDVGVTSALPCGESRIFAYGGAGAGFEEFVSVPLGAGTYFIGVTAYDPSDNAPFTGSYEMTVFITGDRSSSLIPEAEPNDAREQAQSLGAAGALVVFGSAGTEDDTSCGFNHSSGFDDIEDWYSFTVPFKSTVYVLLTGFGTADLDLALGRTGGCSAQNLATSFNNAGEEEEITIELDPGTYTLGVTAYDQDANAPSFRGYLLGVFLTTAPGSADLSVTAIDGPDPATHADQLAYTLRVSNAGPNVGVAVLTGTTPTGTNFAGAYTPQGFYGGPLEGSTGEVGFALGAIPAGASITCTVLLNVTAQSGAVFNSTWQLATGSPDPNASNNSSSTRTSVASGGTARIVWSAPRGNPLDQPLNVSIVRGTTKADSAVLVPGRDIYHCTPGASTSLRGSGTGFEEIGRGESAVTCYKLYKSNSPNVRTSPGNIFATIPAGQTSVSVPVSSRGTYYAVTACYGQGESPSSNQVNGTVPGPTLTGVSISSKKIVAYGSGFSGTIEVFLDGIRFSQGSKVKATKITQKGSLVTGQSILQYLQPGRPVEISFRNSSGGITRATVTPN